MIDRLTSWLYDCYPPSQTFQEHALALGCSGLWRHPCRPSALGRRSGPVPVAYRLHGRWSVAPVARRPQQACATVPFVAAPPRSHSQPVQLLRAFGGGRPPYAMAQHDSFAPHRAARRTRRGPSRSRAVRWSCAPSCKARPKPNPSPSPKPSPNPNADPNPKPNPKPGPMPKPKPKPKPKPRP